MSILHVDWHAKGRAADTERFSYTRITKACLSVSQGAVTSASPTLCQHMTCSLTSFTTSSVSFPDPLNFQKYIKLFTYYR